MSGAVKLDPNAEILALSLLLSIQSSSGGACHACGMHGEAYFDFNDGAPTSDRSYCRPCIDAGRVFIPSYWCGLPDPPTLYPHHRQAARCNALLRGEG